MPRDTELAVALLYPELLGTYGDRGNTLALARRARARGIETRILEVEPGEPIPQAVDIYLLGGSEDATQALAWRCLVAEKDAAGTLAGGAACLAVCAGFQLLGKEFVGPAGKVREGLGLLDVRSDVLPGDRAVSEVVTEPVGIPGLPSLTGYENHQGRTVVGPDARPLGRVVSGVGNGDAGTEGAVQGNVVATYMHGPVLVRNPALTDYLLERAVGTLEPYVDEAVEQLRRERLAAAREGASEAGRR